MKKFMKFLFVGFAIFILFCETSTSVVLSNSLFFYQLLNLSFDIFGFILFEEASLRSIIDMSFCLNHRISAFFNFVPFGFREVG